LSKFAVGAFGTESTNVEWASHLLDMLVLAPRTLEEQEEGRKRCYLDLLECVCVFLGDKKKEKKKRKRKKKRKTMSAESSIEPGTFPDFHSGIHMQKGTILAM